MHKTYFISDLHLGAIDSPNFKLFSKFIKLATDDAKAIYILGDFFNLWIGDDDYSEFINLVKSKLRQLSNKIPVYFMVGNRDFLIKEKFITDTKCIELADPSIIELNGKKILLTHGDLLCDDDPKYLKFRKFVRRPIVQKIFLKLPIALRRFIAQKIRSKSQQARIYSDVNNDLALNSLIDNNVRVMIHGHTHKPKIHHLNDGNKAYFRWVLGDWHQSAQIIVADQNSMQFMHMN